MVRVSFRFGGGSLSRKKAVRHPIMMNVCAMRAPEASPATRKDISPNQTSGHALVMMDGQPLIFSITRWMAVAISLRSTAAYTVGPLPAT